MSKALNIATWAGGIALMVTLLAFSSTCRESIRITDLSIEVDYDTKQYFVNEQEIEDIIRSEYPYLDSLFCKEININLLEERLDNHPAIRKAEVYSAMDGILRIRINQKQPILRVQHTSRGYYLDEKGDSMALSPNFSAEVPLVTGRISATDEAALFKFFNGLTHDKYFNDFFSGVQVEEDGAWILYPRPGRHEVYLGEPKILKAKMERLRKFYETVVDAKNLDSIASLNLAYDKQVVCTKY